MSLVLVVASSQVNVVVAETRNNGFKLTYASSEITNLNTNGDISAVITTTTVITDAMSFISIPDPAAAAAAAAAAIENYSG